MGVEDVREYFAGRDLRYEIQELDESTETVELAARALGVQPALIAKTLAFKINEKGIIIVTRGDARVESKKFKQAFQAKPKMMNAAEVFEMTGHEVGGVCPFGLKHPMEVFLDVSLKPFDKVYPAAGSPNSHIETTPDDLCRITGAQWVDVCREDNGQ